MSQIVPLPAFSTESDSECVADNGEFVYSDAMNKMNEIHQLRRYHYNSSDPSMNQIQQFNDDISSETDEIEVDISYQNGDIDIDTDQREFIEQETEYRYCEKARKTKRKPCNNYQLLE